MSTHRILALTLLAAVLSASAVAQAQPATKVPRLGVLLFSTPQADPNYPAFRQRMTELGYVEGKNVTTVYRFAEGKPDRLPALATELVTLKPDAIFALGGDVAPFVRTATTTIPIVMAVSVDPVQAGLVTNLAKPGGNLTGVTWVTSEVAAKRLQLLKEAVPQVSRIAVLWNPNHVDPEYGATRAAARNLGIEVQSLEIRGPADFDEAFRAAENARAEAIIVVTSRLMFFARERIMTFAGQRGIPVVGGWGPWAQAGALLSYGADVNASVRQAASHVDRVLKGASPSSIAIEQPTQFALVLNRKTANSLGLSIPQSLRVQASQILE